MEIALTPMEFARRARRLYPQREAVVDGWIDYESTLASHPPDFTTIDIAETDLISINYTSGTTARPKGVMITHRNAVGELRRRPAENSDR